MDSISIQNILFFSALALLIIVSAGVLYLTTIEWRDRRLRDKERSAGVTTSPVKKRAAADKKAGK